MAKTKTTSPQTDKLGPWTIQREETSLKTVRVHTYHEDYKATEFEFYFPAAIWTQLDVMQFRNSVANIPQGATVIKSVDGVWQDQSEETHIFRIIVRRGQFSESDLLEWLHNEVSKLTARVSQSKETEQECVMFTRKVITVSMCYLDQSKTSAKRRAGKRSSRRVRRIQDEKPGT